ADVVGVARGDRSGPRGEIVEDGDRVGETGRCGGDDIVERAAIAPGVLGRAAQRARVAVDQLGPRVLVACGAAQIVDDAGLLAAQRAGDPVGVGELAALAG